MRVVPLILTLLVLLAGWPMATTAQQIAASAAAVAATNTPTFVRPQPPQAGIGFAYDLQMTGDLVITQSGLRHEQNISLLAGLEIRWDEQTVEGLHKARLNLVAPHLSVSGKEQHFDLTPGVLDARFDYLGQIAWAQTPVGLADLGVDFTHTLLGLVVPFSAGPVVPGASWEVKSVLGRAPGQVFDLKTTYTFIRFEERRGQLYALVRGSIALKPKEQATRLNYVGRLEAFVEPNTGRVVESATSLDVQSKVGLPTGKPGVTEEVSVRTILTTYLLDLGPAAATAPAVETPEVAEPAEEAPQAIPVVTVGQPAAARETAAATGDPAQAPAAPAEPEKPPTPIRRGPVFVDPAGRFFLILPLGWAEQPQQFSADTTSFAGPLPSQSVYVYVDQAETDSLENFARASLEVYAQNSAQFQLKGDLRPTMTGVVPALTAQYVYPEAPSGRMVEETAVFARYEGHNYILQFADALERPAYEKAALAEYFAGALQLGPTPGGPLPASTLAKADLLTYIDAEQRFSMGIPDLWPLFSRAEDGSSVTFAEVGKKGFLTVYVQSGMERHTADSVLRAWRGQWARQEKEFRELASLAPATLSGYPGSSLAYEWRNSDGHKWLRQLTATIHQGTLYAVVIDYLAEGAVERSDTFQRMMKSFRIHVRQPEPVQSPDAPTGDARPQLHQQQPVIEARGTLSLAAQVKLDEPLGESRVLLVGRLGQRQGEEITWLPGITLRIRAGQSLYATRTDAQGYFAFANLAALSQGSYTLVEAEGPMLGFSQTVIATFSGALVPSSQGRLHSAGHVLLELQGDQGIRVILIPFQNLADPAELPRHFLTNYARSGWSSLLQDYLVRP